MKPRLCFVVIDHLADEYFDEIVAGVHRFCPEADVVWYDSGTLATSRNAHIFRLPSSRPLQYAKIAPFFLDLFEWAIDQPYDFFVNLETDLCFVSDSLPGLIQAAMSGNDYMVAKLDRRIPATSRWRPYRSLRLELSELLDILGTDYVNGGFSPAQVFSQRYIRTLLNSSFYPRLRDFVEHNQRPHGSFTLQEILLPTLPDVLGLPMRNYPETLTRFNRYRPYHGLTSIQEAFRCGAPFAHPIRRDSDDRARIFARSLIE